MHTRCPKLFCQLLCVTCGTSPIGYRYAQRHADEVRCVEGDGKRESNKTMKKLVLLVTVSMLVLGLSVTVLSAAEGKTPQTKSGTVKKVDVDGKQIVVMVTRELTFTVTDETKIMQGDTPKKLADIKVEAKVTVDYMREGDARTAKKIAILAEK
jgi:hypothetical protein